MRKEVNMGLGEMPTGGYFGLLALESRIMFDGSGTDLGEVVYNPNDSSQEDGISVVKESFTGTIFPGNKSLGHSQDNYIRFALANKQEYDTFYLKSSEKNSNNSYSENAILVGDDKTKDYDKDKDKILDLNLWMDLDEKGTKGWRKIGWVTGQNTTDLKIYLFREEFANHDFDKPIEGPNAEGGWTIVGGGLAPGMIGPTIDGKETVMPHPNTRLPSNHPDYLASADDLQAVVDLHRKLKIEMPRFVRDSEGKMGNWDFERRDYVFQGNSSANKALYMESKSIGVEHGGGRVYGPHAYSDELQLFKGEVFTFEYEEGPIGDPGDTGELFSYLLNMDNGKTIILDRLTKDDPTTDAMTRGAENRKHPDGTLSGWKEWRVPITETGRYRLVCAVYAFDESGGGRTGYNVAIDDLGVEMSTTVLDAIVRQVRYEKNTDEFIVPSMDMDQDPRKITISAKFKDGVEREVASGTLDFVEPPTIRPFGDVSNQVIDKGDGLLLFENPDHHHDFSVGKLQITGQGSDSYLFIRNQGNEAKQIGFDKDTKKITYGGKTIGTVDGVDDKGRGKHLHISFQADATPESVEALLRNVACTAPSNVSANGIIARGLTERDGASYDDITQDNKLTYEISKPRDTPFKDVSNQVIDKGDGSLLFENPNYHDFSKGYLRINYASSEQREPGSDLSIGNQGNGSGQIGLDGTKITYEGKTIGTVDATENGKDGKPLRIKFQEGATPRGIEALLRSVTYTAPYKVPAVNVTAQFTESDGTTHDDITLDNKRDYEIKKKKSGRGPEPTPDPIGDQPVTPDDGPTTSQPPSSIWSSYRTSVGRDSSHRSGIYGFRIFGGSCSGESGRFDASVPESRAPLQCYDTNGHTISVGRGIEDQFIDRERFEFRIPIGAFIHTNSKAELEFQATMEDGSALPDWIGFESTVGIFTGVVPDDWDKEVFTLRIIARDIYSGCEAGTTFDLRVAREEGSANTPDNPDIGDKYHGKRNALVSAGGGDRLGLSAQMAAHGRSGFEMRQTAFIAMMSGSG